ncbi:MAG: hypothetical protein KDC24_10470 [Saprospiraceae bacterium]|nr:hypothetical protein [Saprospiraceae bacterium]
MKQLTKTTFLFILFFTLVVSACKKENLESIAQDTTEVQTQTTRLHKDDIKWPEGTSFAASFFFLPESAQFLSMDADGTFKLYGTGALDANGFLKEEGIILDMDDRNRNIDFWHKADASQLMPQQYLKHPLCQEQLKEAADWVDLGLAFSDVELSGQNVFYVGKMFGHLVLCELPIEAGEGEETIIFKPHVNFSYTTGPCGIVYTNDPLVGEVIETATGKHIPFYENGAKE